MREHGNPDAESSHNDAFGEAAAGALVVVVAGQHHQANGSCPSAVLRQDLATRLYVHCGWTRYGAASNGLQIPLAWHHVAACCLRRQQAKANTGSCLALNRRSHSDGVNHKGQRLVAVLQGRNSLSGAKQLDKMRGRSEAQPVGNFRHRAARLL